MRACFGHFTDFRTSPATSCIRVAYYVNDEYTDILVTRENVKKNALYLSVSVFPSTKVLIRHFRNQKETGTSLFFGGGERGAITSGTVTKDTGRTWPIVFSYPDLTLFYTWEIWVRDKANS